jgi:uncharacterized protein YqhQ
MSEETINVGGQAVIEGVMMRTPGAVAIAVRKPSGAISVKTQVLTAPSLRPKWLQIPVIRGIVNLFLALKLGIHALNFSANESLEEEEQESAKEQAPDQKKEAPIGVVSMTLTMLFAFGMGIALFVYLPLQLTNLLKNILEPIANSSLLFNLVDGVIRIAFFLLYLLSISLIKDLRRVFEYHGAEHKTIFTYENGEELTSEQADKYSTFHPRCGTNFLLIVMLLSILVFSILKSDAAFHWKFLSRIVFVPLIAGLSYEVIRFAGKHQDKSWVRWISAPGLFLQRITTKPPSTDQLEVAIRALEEALVLEKTHHASAPKTFDVVI